MATEGITFFNNWLEQESLKAGWECLLEYNCISSQLRYKQLLKEVFICVFCFYRIVMKFKWCYVINIYV